MSSVKQEVAKLADRLDSPVQFVGRLANSLMPVQAQTVSKEVLTALALRVDELERRLPQPEHHGRLRGPRGPAAVHWPLNHAKRPSMTLDLAFGARS
jgi:hypothetical protein